MTTRNSRAAAASVLAGILGGVTTAVLRRMEAEYETRDTLSAGTVVAMYATYGAHAAALMWSGRRHIGLVPLPHRPCLAAGGVLAAGGLGVALAGARPFGMGAQISGVEPGSLHADGIYRYSRNLQYLGLGLAATGAAVATRSAFAGLIATGVWSAYRRWIPSEERHLARTLGDQYVAYQATVRRWLGKRRSH